MKNENKAMARKNVLGLKNLCLFITILIFSSSIYGQTNQVAEKLGEAAYYLQNNQPDVAEQLLRNIIKSSPTNVDAHNLLGVVLDQKGDLVQAEREYRVALKLNPKAVSPLANLGVLLAKTGRQAEALKTLEGVLRLSPNHQQTIINLGFLYSSMGDLPHAVEYLQKANQIQPDNYEILFKFGTTLYQTQKLEEAKKLFTSANIISPTLAEPVYFIGLIAFDQANLELAARYFENALALKPAFADANFMLGEILAKQNRYSEAVRFYEKAVAQDRTRSVYFVRLGGTYLLNYEPIKSFQYFKEAAEIFPEIAEIKYFLAIAARTVGEYDLAISETKKALALKETADANALLGSIQVDRNNFPEAEKYLRKALILNPKHSNSQHDLGRILVKQQRFAEALPFLQRAASQMPNIADVHYQLFLTYTRLKRKVDADKEFQLFKQLSDKK